MPMSKTIIIGQSTQNAADLIGFIESGLLTKKQPALNNFQNSSLSTIYRNRRPSTISRSNLFEKTVIFDD
jgi:hypothetical protein